MTQKVKASEIYASLKFRIDKTSWSEINKFEKKIDTLRNKLKGLSSGSVRVGGTSSGGGGIERVPRRYSGYGGAGGNNMFSNIGKLGFLHRQREAFLKSVSMTQENAMRSMGFNPADISQQMEILKQKVREGKLLYKEFQNEVRALVVPYRQQHREQIKQNKTLRENAALARRERAEKIRGIKYEDRMERTAVNFNAMLRGLKLDKSKIADARREFERLTAIQRSAGPDAMGKYQNSVNRLTKDLRHASANTRTLWQTFLKLRGVLTVVGATAASMGVVASVGKQLESSKIMMDTVFGEQSAAQMAFIRKESNRLGLELVSTSKSYAQLGIAMREAGADMNSMQEIFSGINEYALVTGANSDDLQGVFRALIQMYSCPDGLAASHSNVCRKVA